MGIINQTRHIKMNVPCFRPLCRAFKCTEVSSFIYPPLGWLPDEEEADGVDEGSFPAA